MSWIQEALARRQQQTPQPQQYKHPPVGAPQTVAPAPMPQYGAPPAYPGQPPLQQFAQPPDVPQIYVNSDGSINVPPGVQLSAYQRAAAAVGDKGRTKVCPECQQDSLYEVTTSENGIPLRNPPRPTCMNCGWPYMQSSSLHGSASVAKATGPGRKARQRHDRIVNIYDDRGRVIESFEPQVSSMGGSYV